MVEQGYFSTKEQAIILDTIEEHILQEYTITVENLIDSRILYVVSLTRGFASI